MRDKTVLARCTFCLRAMAVWGGGRRPTCAKLDARWAESRVTQLSENGLLVPPLSHHKAVSQAPPRMSGTSSRSSRAR